MSLCPACLHGGQRRQDFVKDRGAVMIGRLWRSAGRDRDAAELYLALVAQSRRPAFYSHGGVPDSTVGRFNMIVLHAFLVFHRLKADRPRTDALAQALFDHMFADMDRSLREMGIGDLVIGKKVKRLARGFYGRVVAYERALAASDDGPLEAALCRNLFDDVVPAPEQVAGMASYLRGAVATLADRPVEGLTTGGLALPLPQGWE